MSALSRNVASLGETLRALHSNRDMYIEQSRNTVGGNVAKFCDKNNPESNTVREDSVFQEKTK